MNNKNISLVLLFFIAAIVAVPAVSANPSENSACTDCHAYPPTTISITPNMTTINVNPGQAFAVGLTWAGGNPSGATTIKWPSVQDNNLFSPNPVMPINGNNLVSGTTSSVLTAPSSTGTYVVRVYAARKSPRETDYKDITVTVSTPAPIPVLTTITVSPATPNLIIGATQVFTAASKDQNGNPIIATITWTSSNSTVGTIDAIGNFTALAAGTSTVKAENGTVNGTALVTVSAQAPAPVLTTITVSPGAANLIVGKIQAFKAISKDQNGKSIDAAITWTSSNSTVGTIDANGSFTALAAGTSTVKAENGTVNGTALVTVTAKAARVLTTIKVSPASANLFVGKTIVFTAIPKDQNGKHIAAAITWTSSNSTVGTIDAKGKFTALAAGTATIKAENGTVNGTAKVTVRAPRVPVKYMVTFIVTDNVTGKPIHDAKVSMDGLKKETNRNGIAIFNKVSPGNHTYQIKAEHYEKTKGTINVTGNMNISVKLIPIVEKKEEKEDDQEDKKDD